MQKISEWISDINNVLKKQNIFLKENEYDTIIVKQLKASNTLDENRTTNQTHIAITGEQMDIFPFFISPSYYENKIKENKKHFITKININLNKNNIFYLEDDLNKIEDDILINTFTNIVCSFRKDGSRQLQMSFLDMDDKDFIKFRRLLNTDDYLIVLKASKSFKYIAFGIKEQDILDVKKYNNRIIINSKTVTPVNVNAIVDESRMDKNDPIQKIYFGVPGTGKSYNATKLVKKYHPNYGERHIDCPYVYRTTIYPEYSYYDFIGNILPVVENNEITYNFKPGIFTKALSKALDTYKDNIPIFLIIEEMSRGNIASIFGDIFQLLDRDEKGFSEYSINNDLISKYFNEEEIEEYKSKNDLLKTKIYLPPNLNIIGTINTSDQNIFVMDNAFKRRFDFEYVDINPITDDKNGGYLNEFSFKLDDYDLKWNNFYQKINNYIITSLELPEDKQIGQFFIKFDKNNSKENYKQLQGKLLQYLWEDVHLINITGYRLFKKEYTSFSKLYKAFGEQKNVFDMNFMEVFDNQLIEELGNVAERKEIYAVDEEV